MIAPVVLPLTLMARAIGLLKDTPADLTPADVALYFDDFLNDRGNPFDWDDFTSITLADPALDEIREEATFVPLPLDANGRTTLIGLLERVRALSDVR